MHPQTAYRWFREGTLPVAAVRVNSRSVRVGPGVAVTVGQPAARIEAEAGSGVNGARAMVRRLPVTSARGLRW